MSNGGGFGLNIFGQNKGNLKSLRLGQNSQQNGKTKSRLNKLSSRWDKLIKIGQHITQSISLSILMGNMPNIADGCKKCNQFSLEIYHKQKVEK